MNIRNCKDCGKLFQYDGVSKLCYQCRKKEDEDFKVVKDYIYDNPKATIVAVSEETGVSEEKILGFLRQGRLEIVGENSGLVLDCENCGKSIRTGRFCDECAHEMERGFKGGFERPERKVKKSSEREKMFTADSKKRR